MHSCKILRRGDLKNTLCIIANYLIDTLCNDSFQIEKGGILKEGLVSVGVKKEDVGDCNENEEEEGLATSTTIIMIVPMHHP